ncbi:tetratricopeptide repeat protein [Actinoplanes sp. CA-030573]|uniref:tetratricopeptide repeat protein n=1 Tax=Actinoplanes sp. CA-030573 TaxID=3239898 RepID=UPI003D8CB1E4
MTHPDLDRESWQRDFEVLMRNDPGGAADALLAVWPEVERDAALVDLLRADAEALLQNSGGELWRDGLHQVVFRAGNSLPHQGRLAAAVTYWERLLPTASERLGPEHPDTLTIKNNLYWAYGRSGDVDRALTGFRDLLATRRRVLGETDPNTLATRHALATWLDEAGDRAGAVALLRELVADYQRILGPDHRDTLNTRIALAEILGGESPSGAVAELRPLLADFRRKLGPDDPEVLEVEVELCGWLAATGTLDEALVRMARLVDDYRRVLGPTHHDTLTVRFVALDMRAKISPSATAEMRALLAEIETLLNAGRDDVADIKDSIESWLA